MAAVEKLGGNWVIVRADSTNASNDTDGFSAVSEIASSSTREFWTGDGWATQFGFARQFLTQQEAENHLVEHQHRMA